MGTGVTYSALDWRVSDSLLVKIFPKNSSPGIWTLTLIRESLILVTVTVVPLAPSVMPFFADVWSATHFHFSTEGEQVVSRVLSAAQTTPARAAASAARCILVARAYQD